MHFSFSALFFAKVKHHKSPANRAKIGGRVHFCFSKENRVKCTVRLEPDSFSDRIIPMLMKQEHENLRGHPGIPVFTPPSWVARATSPTRWAICPAKDRDRRTARAPYSGTGSSSHSERPGLSARFPLFQPHSGKSKKPVFQLIPGYSSLLPQGEGVSNV